MRWIPCKGKVDSNYTLYISDERLADFRGHILVSCYKRSTKRYKVVQVHISYGRIDGNIHKIDDLILAWMFLPEPYPYKGNNRR